MSDKADEAPTGDETLTDKEWPFTRLPIVDTRKGREVYLVRGTMIATNEIGNNRPANVDRGETVPFIESLEFDLCDGCPDCGSEFNVPERYGCPVLRCECGSVFARGVMAAIVNGDSAEYRYMPPI